MVLVVGTGPHITPRAAAWLRCLLIETFGICHDEG